MLLCWWWFRCAGGDVVVLVSCLFVNCCSGAFDETIWAHDACKKRFVFLLQRFALVVQEREYIRVRGFHLAFWKFRSIYASSTWILPVVSHCQKWLLLPRDYDPVWLEESGLVRVKYQSDTSKLFGWLHIRKVRSLGYTFWNQDELHDFIVSELKPKLCLKLGCHLLGYSVSKRAILDYP